MKQIFPIVLTLALGLFAIPVHASFHNFRIDQVFSNADGTIQYVVMREAFNTNGEGFWTGHQLETTSLAGTKQEFRFQSDLPSQATAGRKVLIATSGFAALNLVTPDYTVPNGFIPVGGGKLDYAEGTDQMMFGALPTDGATAIDHNGAHVPATPTNFAGVTTTLHLGPVATRPDLNQHGLTGSWYEPATSGQGIEVEFYPNAIAPGTALVAGAWFTFGVTPNPGVDGQRWYSFDGNGQSGSASVPLTLYRNVGGNFDAAPQTNAVAVGSGTLAFTDCSTGTLTYAFSDGSGRSGSIPLTRITGNVTCVTAGPPPTSADFALSGNWYDITTSGQGFLFEVNPNQPFFFITWYTYAPAGQAANATRQRWFSGGATYVPGSRTITIPLYETTGGVFDLVTNPLPSTVPVGSATVTFGSCTSAQFQFNFTSGSNAGRANTIALTRVGPAPPGCTQAAAAMPAPMMPGYPG